MEIAGTSLDSPSVLPILPTACHEQNRIVPVCPTSYAVSALSALLEPVSWIELGGV